MKKILLIIIPLIVIAFAAYFCLTKMNFSQKYKVGEVVDSLDNVKVFYNGGVHQSHGRNLADNGYNIGIKYQCVEFVKRYYYEYYNHKMPDSYGNAKDFFDKKLGDGDKNVKRNLIQYSNPSKTKPQKGDIIVLSENLLNPYGHVAIISSVQDTKVEIIQQNYGLFGSPREKFSLLKNDILWKIDNNRVLGWLRKE